MEGKLVNKMSKYYKFGVFQNEARVNNSNALTTLPIVCIHSNIRMEYM